MIANILKTNTFKSAPSMVRSQFSNQIRSFSKFSTIAPTFLKRSTADNCGECSCDSKFPVMKKSDDDCGTCSC
ncbi:hypothetical protein WICPIJ_002224 [Wickerhamomyces pijperi]|uniref:Uncharacterized protein n=1 Tax=Wickerhamomyces pijperi TaxID=599730 RepID=A0A9P8QC44_WICPI|nr:hypothetical protein WICPIJ_002224 [Wickerhamomyces pijperi]